MKTIREILTWLILGGQAVYVAFVWPTLPAMLPSHFGLNGVANRYAPKSFLWVVVGIAAGMVVLLTVVERFPRAFNLPKPVGDADRPRLEAIAREMLSWMRLEVAGLFAFLVWSVVQVGLNRSGGLGSGFVVVTLTAVMLTAVYFIWQMKSPEQA